MSDTGSRGSSRGPSTSQPIGVADPHCQHPRGDGGCRHAAGLRGLSVPRDPRPETRDPETPRRTYRRAPIPGDGRKSREPRSRPPELDPVGRDETRDRHLRHHAACPATNRCRIRGVAACEGRRGPRAASRAGHGGFAAETSARGARTGGQITAGVAARAHALAHQRRGNVRPFGTSARSTRPSPRARPAWSSPALGAG